MPDKIIPPKAGFTSTFLTKLKAQDKPYEISDPGCKGLRIKVSTAGSKIFLATLYIKSKRRILTLGHYPGTLLADARTDLIHRKEANKKGTLVTDVERKTKEKIEQDALETQQYSDSVLMGTILDEFEELVVKKRRSWKSPLSMIRVHIRGQGEVKPCIVLADIPIRSVTKQDVKELLFSLRETRPGVVLELFPMLRHFFEWSVRQEYLSHSPISAGDKQDWKLVKQPANDFPLDVDDKGRVVTALPEIKRFFHILDNEFSKKVALPLKLLLLTGTRTGELLLSEKHHLDFNKMEWFIPKQNTKSYRPEKNIDTSLIVPLTDYTAELFKELMERSDDKYFITVARNTLPWAVRSIVTKHKFKRFTPHTLRKTLRSHITGWCSFEVAEKCLNHSLGTIAGTYDHGSMLDERRKALTVWSDKVYRAVYGSDDNVIQLRLGL